MKSNKIVNEVYQLEEIVEECLQMDEDSYIKMPLEQLYKQYDRIENGLISFNIASKDNSDFSKEVLSELAQDIYGIGNFLESQLLNIIASVIIKNPLHPLPQRFKDSLWASKLKNKEYYEDIFELTGIDDKKKDMIYNFIQN